MDILTDYNDIENADFSYSNSLIDILDDETNYQLSSPKPSSYIDVSEFGKQLQETKSKLSILSLNICNIHTKFEEFKIVIAQINQHHQVSVICIQETWLSSDDILDSYQLSHRQVKPISMVVRMTNENIIIMCTLHEQTCYSKI